MTVGEIVPIRAGVSPVGIRVPALHDRPADALRVMTLNLWCEATERLNRHRIAGELAKALDVDVLLVQEVAHGPLDETLDVVASVSGLSLAAISPVTGGNRNAVLTRLPATPRRAIRYTVPDSPFDQLAAVASVRTSGGRDVLVVSAHLLWGGLAERGRLLQAEAIDAAVVRLLEEGSVHAVWGGDFNTGADSSTLRFLQGKEAFAGHAAQWTDAFTCAGVGSGSTSSGSNPWARTVALAHGFLDASGVPERRIDFLLVRGYAHGRACSPIRSFVVPAEMVTAFVAGAPFPPSDHDPVVADLWDPPVAP